MARHANNNIGTLLACVHTSHTGRMLGIVRTSFSRNAIPAKSAAAATPAAVPSRLTAPSVPLGTTFNVVIRYAVLP